MNYHTVKLVWSPSRLAQLRCPTNYSSTIDCVVIRLYSYSTRLTYTYLAAVLAMMVLPEFPAENGASHIFLRLSLLGWLYSVTFSPLATSFVAPTSVRCSISNLFRIVRAALLRKEVVTGSNHTHLRTSSSTGSKRETSGPKTTSLSTTSLAPRLRYPKYNIFYTIFTIQYLLRPPECREHPTQKEGPYSVFPPWKQTN